MQGAIKLSHFGYQMLVTHFDDVIKEIKDPLRKVILLVTRRLFAKFGEPERWLTCSLTTQSILDIRRKFLNNCTNPAIWDRAQMTAGVMAIYAEETEHDPAYRFFGDWGLEEVIKKILAGAWESRGAEMPDVLIGLWQEATPYGGENSIVFQLMKHRDEINRILGRQT